MEIKPIQDRVLVKRFEEETTTASGLIIPDNSKEKPLQGEIIAVGSGYRKSTGDMAELEVKVGDKVFFGKYAGTELKHEGNDYIVMKEDDILAVIR